MADRTEQMFKKLSDYLDKNMKLFTEEAWEGRKFQVSAIHDKEITSHS